MNELILKGIDGANPLGFLAAVGTFRTASRALGDACLTKMAWRQHDGAWRPVLQFDFKIEESDLVSKLNLRLKEMENHPAFGFSDNLTVAPDVFRSEVMSAQEEAKPDDRFHTDFLSAFGCESVSDEKSDTISNTAMRTMSGAGHQNFLSTIRQLVSDTEDSHIAKTLFSIWIYGDPVEKHTMRWDPNDDVRYALQWQNPSGDKNRKIGGGMWGANRLAIEALPLFTTAPKNRCLETTGFSQKKGKGVFFSWPIWEPLISIDTLRSLLSLNELQELNPDRKKLIKIGVVEVFRSQRLTEGKFRNFSTAMAV